MKKFIAPLGIVALLLTGCGESLEPSSEVAAQPPTATAPPTIPGPAGTTTAPEPLVFRPGSYTFESDGGGTGTIEAPGAPPAELEALREQAGAEPVTYLTGHFDNRDGTTSFDVYTITVYDPEGNAYDYLPASEWLGEIRPSTKEVTSDVYNQYIDASNDLNNVITPFHRADYIMVGPELPAEITGIRVSSGYTDVMATPAP